MLYEKENVGWDGSVCDVKEVKAVAARKLDASIQQHSIIVASPIMRKHKVNCIQLVFPRMSLASLTRHVLQGTLRPRALCRTLLSPNSNMINIY